jgi:myo-inositol-1(or 4)-monophosphatase
MNIDHAKDIAIQAVLQAGDVLKENLNKIKTVTQKSDRRDLVTNVDLEVEKILLSAVQKDFPTHSILSEEAGEIFGESEYEWVIDPIDGTINYTHAHPPFRIGCCLLREGQPILTVMYGPTRDQLFVAVKGKGATLNQHPIHVSQNQDLQNSIFMTHLSSKRFARLRTIASLERVYTHTSHVRMFGSGLASMSYIAEGRYDVFYNVETKPWDILPGKLLIEEAGGKVTEISGQEINLKSTSVLATNGLVHNQMLELLADI